MARKKVQNKQVQNKKVAETPKRFSGFAFVAMVAILAIVAIVAIVYNHQFRGSVGPVEMETQPTGKLLEKKKSKKQASIPHVNQFAEAGYGQMGC